ncbi:MAG: hypothetical protein AB7S56_08595 [Halothiobacillaceae bacterium]
MISTKYKPLSKQGFFSSPLFVAGLISALIALLALIFYFALPGIIHFDDRANLSGLGEINNFNDALRWSLEGFAGPTGRPLSLMSFAIQFYQWPNPEAFLEWNIAFHIINSLLVFWLGLLLTQAYGLSLSRSIIIAWITALLWGALPLLNSSVLFIVQRMNVLSSLFMLLGLISYVKFRTQHNANSLIKQLIAISALGFFALLGILSKENAALIVFYALLLEIYFIQRNNHQKIPKAYALILLITGSIILISYLASMMHWGKCAELTRGYGVWDRLASQGHILFAYIKTAFLPRLAELNPFRFQAIEFTSTYLITGWALYISFWLALFVSILKRWKILSFALAWFMLGHLMESSWLALEPYFAHRNYLPIFGIILGLFIATLCKATWRSPWAWLAILYAAIMMSMSILNTRLWGNAPLAAEIWLKEEPRSNRAALNLAYSLEAQFGIVEAQVSLDDFADNSKNSIGLRLQKIITACSLNPSADHANLVIEAIHAINTLPYEGWATDLVQELDATIVRSPCQGVTNQSIAEIAQAFLSKPAYTCSAAITHNMHSLVGLVAMRHGDPQQALHHWKQALKSSMAYGVALLSFDTALNTSDRQSAEIILEMVKNAPPPRGTTQAEWQALYKTMHEQYVALLAHTEE